ncbi:transcriptional regulator [Lentzea albida]|uniref:Transcriptional regulator n=1 Tax=Lentzea albida TaxID=65499 RepID=A0A1H9X604_9PSEU|nr:transcriptional regulator [Lentzea albida]
MDALRRDLHTTRMRGYAVDDEQNTQGVTCAAVALPGRPGTPTAVSATMLTVRATTELSGSVVADLIALAGQLSRVTNV